MELPRLDDLAPQCAICGKYKDKATEHHIVGKTGWACETCITTAPESLRSQFIQVEKIRHYDLEYPGNRDLRRTS